MVKDLMVTVRETLKDLEQKLLSSIAVLNEQLTPLQNELADVRKALGALPAQNSIMLTVDEHAEITDWASSKKVEARSIQQMSMKELVVKALRERFKEGATAAELLQYFHGGWGRIDVVRSSLSPQLSRLRGDGVIDRDGYRWFLVT